MSDEQIKLATQKLWEQALLAPTGTVFHLTREEILKYFAVRK